MNAERLHTVAKAMLDDLTATKVEKRLEALTAAIQQLATQPPNPAHQQQVDSARQELRAALESASSNGFPPTWQQAIGDLGAVDLLGARLAARVEKDVFAGNELTPAVAQREIEPIKKEVGKLAATLRQLIAAFEYLRISSEELQPGEAELGFLMPRGFVKNHLSEFADELAEVNKMVGVFSEITTGSRPPLEIRTISSSDFTVFLSSAPVVVACAAKSIQWVLQSYKTLLEIRKLKGEMEKQNLPAQVLDQVSQYADGEIDRGIEKAVPAILNEFYKGNDTGRKNELGIELRLTLREVAVRVDRGYNFEARAEPTAAPAAPDGEDIAHHVELIKEASTTLQFLKPDGPPLLSLPAGEETTEAGEQRPTAEEKRSAKPRKAN